MSKLQHKVALITGAAKGIGAAIATYFAAEGASVVVNYAASKESADQVVRAITASGGRAIAVQADVANEADVARLFTETKAAFVANTPLGRRGQPADIAKAAVFLASDEAAWITGEQLAVSGGMYGF